MKAKPYKLQDGAYCPVEPNEATHVMLHMPCGCINLILPVMIGGTRAGTGNWTWNGDTEKPTLKPSVLTRGGDFVCHTWINDGQVQFLSDTVSTARDMENRTHDGYANTTKPLLEIESDNEK